MVKLNNNWFNSKAIKRQKELIFWKGYVMKFKLEGTKKRKFGGHSQGGRSYETGDIVESDSDLCLRFPGKFERVDEKISSSTGEVDTAAKVQRKPNIPVRNTLAPVKTQEQEEPEELEEVEDNTEKDESNDEKVTEEEVTPHPEFGEDITKDFPEAAASRLKIYINKAWCQVVDDDNGSVLNDKKLRRNEIEDFIKQYSSGENADLED